MISIKTGELCLSTVREEEGYERVGEKVTINHQCNFFYWLIYILGILMKNDFSSQ